MAALDRRDFLTAVTAGAVLAGSGFKTSTPAESPGLVTASGSARSESGARAPRIYALSSNSPT
jgi:hypothetical protein